ncbi:MAG: alpha-ketoacid dehydrogenase subunit beta [Eubacteriales bacterium]|nr:alpha-ketoacid dehydrogenase subunit beta [Eubacteriales bacterium]
MAIKTYANAIRDCIAQEMRLYPNVFVMGEDVGLQGGIFGCTRGLYNEFGAERVVDTPMSECSIVGAAIGAAYMGKRPIVELMYVDFSLLAFDQLLNTAAKARYMFGEQHYVPMVFRMQQGIGRANGPNHSQSFESMFCHVPGLKVCIPSNPADAAGLLRSAIRSLDPVVFLEHKALYATKSEVPDDSEFMIPFGSAKIVREGTDVTIYTNFTYVQRCVKVADRLEKERGISCEVIDPRTMVPFDKKTLLNSLKKTGKLIIVHEAWKPMGVGAEIAAIAAEEGFSYLKAPVVRVCSKHQCLPFNLDLENAVVPQDKEIEEGILKVM